MTTNRKLLKEPESCLTKPEIDLLEQTRNWANAKLTITLKLCDGYPKDVRLAKEKEMLVALVQACNSTLFFYAL